MLLVGGNLMNQRIDWWHGALDSTGEHQGNLISRIGELNLNLGITDDWNLQINLIGGNRSMDFPSVPNIHHRNEDRGGIADTKLMLRYLVSNSDFGPGDRFFLGFGLSIPSDNTLSRNPFLLGRQGKEHTHFDMSEGVYRSLNEVQFFRRTESPFVVGGVVRLEVPFGQNQYGYLPGTQLTMAGMAYWQGKSVFGGMPYFLSAGQFRSKDYWNGEEAPNSGAIIIQAGGGLVWNVNESLITFSIQAPVVFKANMVGEDASVDSRANVWIASISLRKIFDVSALIPSIDDEELEEHEHEHEDEINQKMIRMER